MGGDFHGTFTLRETVKAKEYLHRKQEVSRENL